MCTVYALCIYMYIHVYEYTKYYRVICNSKFSKKKRKLLILSQITASHDEKKSPCILEVIILLLTASN